MPFTLAVQRNTTKKRIKLTRQKGWCQKCAPTNGFFFRARIILNCAHICVCVRRGRYFAQIRYSRTRCCLLLSADWLIRHFRVSSDWHKRRSLCLKHVMLLAVSNSCIVDTKYFVINLLSTTWHCLFLTLSQNESRWVKKATANSERLALPI